MKCDKCGFKPNPGDQICMNCGAKLSLVNVVVPEVEKVEVEPVRNTKKIVIISVVGVLLLIILVFVIVRFLIL